ncbi:hypothetical protein H6G54_02810 [Anabaena cylindrica FACHB-243]|nr:hypothetical protein [Anabaena cylindrica FACHB-243]MBY5281104.1 hypothetical protein [Anabaena sp. CCAP 1446/1C]MBY5306730.1 hypothetical protein [Anabaena sp. CCAP 1446/1C]BAY06756.1 hypothetical protein NIES19_60390 [Anabaena cylindrica PCC 7122]
MIHNLNMTDTEYTQLAAQLGETQQEARKLTRIVGLTKDKSPETDNEEIYAILHFSSYRCTPK